MPLTELIGAEPKLCAIPEAIAFSIIAWRAAASFLPANRIRRLLRGWITRATRVAGLDRIVGRIAESGPITTECC